MRRKRKYLILVWLAILALWFTGCGGSEAPANESFYNDVGDQATSEEPAAPQGETSHDQSSSPAQQRLVIMSGRLEVETYHPEEIVAFITDLADRYRGFVVKSNLTSGFLEDETPASFGEVVIRIPAGRLRDAITEIKAQDLNVLYEDLSGEDVTADYVDLKSRLRNLEDAAEQLRLIMENSNDTEAVLEVYKELSKVTEEAEIIKGQLQYYEEAAAMSSLSVTINPIIDKPEPTPTPTPEPWKLGPTFENSTERLTKTSQRWVEGVVRFLVYGLPTFVLQTGPWLLAFYFIGRWAYRRFIKPKDSSEDSEKSGLSKLDD